MAETKTQTEVEPIVDYSMFKPSHQKWAQTPITNPVAKAVRKVSAIAKKTFDGEMNVDPEIQEKLKKIVNRIFRLSIEIQEMTEGKSRSRSASTRNKQTKSKLKEQLEKLERLEKATEEEERKLQTA